MLAKVCARLKLKEDTLNNFYGMLEKGPMQRAGMHPHLASQIAERTRDTWFQVPGAEGIAASGTGTRPGTTAANAFFNFAFAGVVEEVHKELVSQGIAVALDEPGVQATFTEHYGAGGDVLTSTSFVDDMVAFVWDNDPRAVIRKVAAATDVIRKAMARMGAGSQPRPGQNGGLALPGGPRLQAGGPRGLHRPR